MAALGGRENAFTGKDYTGYYQRVTLKDAGGRVVFNREAENKVLRESSRAARPQPEPAVPGLATTRS